MRRASAVILALLVVVPLLAESAEAQVPGLPTRRSSGSGSVTGCFVLVEKTGIDIYCGLYSTMTEVKERGEAVVAENDRLKAVNEGIDKEIKTLRERIAAKAREMEKAEDDAQKAAISKEMEALRNQIPEKEAARPMLTKLIGPAKFRSVKEAEQFIEKTYEEADKIKEEIEDKEREEAKKKRDEAAKKAEEAQKKAAEEGEKKGAEEQKKGEQGQPAGDARRPDGKA